MASKMRSISFVERLELEFYGNIYGQSICLGDVNNDKHYELVAGNIDGRLFIYKEDMLKPWKEGCDLGLISAIVVGDVCSRNKNYIAVLNTEGWCYLFSVSSDSSTSRCFKKEERDSPELIRPFFKQNFGANVKSVLIADIDGDGRSELIIGYSDRRVQSFRWQKEPGDGEADGSFVRLWEWQLAGQLSSMTVNGNSDGSLDLMVSQPGGIFVVLKNGDSSLQGMKQQDCMLESHNITSEVIGDIKQRDRKGNQLCNLSAICTLNGNITLVNHANEDKILWSLCVDRQLFALSKLDITGDGCEEVVACSWDGQTYLINLRQEVVRFKLEEATAAFTTGYYHLFGENRRCLIYVTFENKIYVYYNVWLPEMGSTNLIDGMAACSGTGELLRELNVDIADREQLRELFHWCLYGRHDC